MLRWIAGVLLLGGLGLALFVFVLRSPDGAPTAGGATALSTQPLGRQVRPVAQAVVEHPAQGSPAKRTAAQQAQEPTTGGARPIDWPPAASVNYQVLGSLGANAQSAVDESPVPVLLPEDPRLASSANVSRGRDWYAASMSSSEGSVVINATRAKLSIPDLPPPAEAAYLARSRPARVSLSEGVWVVSWEEFGVSYLLRMTCSPERPERCRDESHLLALADSLVYVGGAR